MFYLNGRAIRWKSGTIANSTIKVVYIVAIDATTKLFGKQFISKLSVVPGIENDIKLYCDDYVPIAQSKEPRSHQNFNHVLRTYPSHSRNH